VFTTLELTCRGNCGYSSKTKGRYKGSGLGEYLAGLEIVQERIENTKRFKSGASEASTTSTKSKDESFTASLAQIFLETTLLAIEGKLGVPLNGTGSGKFNRWRNPKLHPYPVEMKLIVEQKQN
jgi:hypothetical protein